jgi:hypothetical protein
MMSVTRIAVAALSLSISGMAIAKGNQKSVAELYVDASTWKEMNWSDTEHSPLSSAEGWTPHTGEQTFDDRVQISDGSVQVAGHRFAAALSHGKGAPAQQYFSMSDQVSDCGEMLPLLSGIYGTATRKGSFELVVRVTPTAAFTNVSSRAQWDIGTTRVTALCNKMSSSAEGSIGVFFDAITSAKLLTPAFALRCTGMKARMFGREQDAQDLAYWVDPFSGLILMPNHEHFANGAILTDTELKFARKTSTKQGGQEIQGEYQYTIDRITGNLKITGVSHGQNIEFTGKCEKNEDLKLAF